MPFPRDPIAAVTHPDPYPYYAHLAATAPLAHDDALGLWVAAGASAVAAVLAGEQSAVRPAAEPVPAALVGTAAGELFARLVRTRDGERHRALKPAVSARLDAHPIAESAVARARALANGFGPAVDPRRITAFALALPVHAIGDLLGLPDGDRGETVRLVDDLVACFAPGSRGDRIERGVDAAARLLAQVQRLHPAGTPDPVIANEIGLLIQAYEATAGLIGNTLVALGRDADLRQRIGADLRRVGALVADVARDDPPVQNTRRYVVRDGRIADCDLRAGDAILVILASADRFSFGAGAHLCPGSSIAISIAEIAIQQLLSQGVDPAPWIQDLSYRPSVNARVPVFGAAGEPS